MLEITREGACMRAGRQIRRVWLLGALLIAATGLQAQSPASFNVGIGYFADNITHPGVVGQLELERHFGGGVSVPSSASLAVHKTPDYYAMTLSVHTGFRKYLAAGLFIEQSIGIGVVANVFTVDSIWYIDRFGAGFRYSNGPNFGIVPSVTVGAGIDLGGDSGRAHLV
jgi:hypothetical protein